VRDRRAGTSERVRLDDPLERVRALSRRFVPHAVDPMPAAFHGGWVGFCAFDAVRWLEPSKLPFASAPRDDRGLPDMHFGMYREVAVFDHVAKVVHAVVSVPGDEHADEAAALRAGRAQLDAFCARLVAGAPPLAAGAVELDVAQRPVPADAGSMTRARFEEAVRRVMRSPVLGRDETFRALSAAFQVHE
jgi:anthranilate synthase component 1